MSTKPSIPYRTAVGIEASVVIGTTVTAIISPPNTRTAVVEITAIVAAIDGEVPYTCTPYYRTKEVVGGHQKTVLPVVQNGTQIAQAIAVVVAIDIGRRVNTKEVIEVNLVGIIILLVVEVKLVSHLVRQVKSLFLCTFKTHCVGTQAGCHHKHQGDKNLFHSSVVLSCL